VVLAGQRIVQVDWVELRVVISQRDRLLLHLLITKTGHLSPHMASKRIGSHGSRRVSAKLRHRIALVVRQVVVDEEIVTQYKLTPYPFPQFRIAWQVCRPLAAVALCAVISKGDLAASEYRGIACQVRLPTPGRLAVACRL